MGFALLVVRILLFKIPTKALYNFLGVKSPTGAYNAHENVVYPGNWRKS